MSMENYVIKYAHSGGKNHLFVRQMIEQYIKSGKPKLEVIFSDCEQINSLQSQLTEALERLEICEDILEAVASPHFTNAHQRAQEYFHKQNKAALSKKDGGG